MFLFPTRRKFLKLGAAGIAAGALGIAGDGTFFEANRPKLVSLDVHLNRLPDAWDGFRIAQLSDLHYDEYFSVVPLRKAVDIVSGLQPDLIVVTGDFVTSRGRRRHRENAIHAAKAIEPCAQLLAKMHAPSGILASLGNHDVDGDPSHIIDVLQSHNISVLRNRSVPLERESKRLWLCGVDDILSGKPRLDLALKEIPGGRTCCLAGS